MRNKKIWEYTPKQIKTMSILLIVLSICLLALSLPLVFVAPVGGIIGIIFTVLLFVLSRKYKQIAKDIEAGTFKPPVSASISSISKHMSTQYFNFPSTDGHGHRALTIYDMNVSGVLKEQNGIDPQTVIPNLYPGEQILLEADPDNKYDEYAVKVKTLDGIQIGWLPMGENLQIDISRRLNEGQTVYARVKKGYNLDLYPGKIGLIIDVARYSK